jgi:hypothetical protein
MFLGHYAVGFASKKFAPRTSLGALMAAPILLDLLWPIFLLMGLESVSIEAAKNPFLRLHFDSYPISHGLVAVIAWATLFASIYFGLVRYLEGAIVIWVGVMSHWLLDYIAHRPDLPLSASSSRLLGLGLWNYRWQTIAVELLLLVLGVWVYVRETRAKDKIGSYGFAAFIVLLLAAYAGAAFGPAPSSVKKLAIVTLFTWLFIPWAWWFDHHRELREPRITESGPGGQQVRLDPIATPNTLVL